MYHISWKAPFYIHSKIKYLIIFLIILLFAFFLEFIGVDSASSSYIVIILSFTYVLLLFLKRKDPHAKYLQLFHKKTNAKYLIKENYLYIEYKKNKFKKINLNKNFLYSKTAPQLHRFYSSPEFKIIYLIKKGLIFKKYIPIFIPNKEFTKIDNFLSKKLSRSSNSSIDKSTGDLKFLKYFGYTLIGVILIINIVVAIYRFKCIGYAPDAPRDSSTFINAWRTCSM
jgi:hypothetical protein